MAIEKVILAYSGGLDTSCILKWLLEKKYEVICVMADVGQQEDFEAARQKALKIGAQKVIVADVKQSFVEHYIWPAVQMGLIYEERYLLGTSLARPCISVALVKAAQEHGAKYLAHGATGKGNDQVRFELCAYALQPNLKIIAPWRDVEFCSRFQGRLDLIEYARESGIEVSAKPTAPWSTDANIMHISYESGVLEDPSHVAPSSLYELTVDPLTQAPQRTVRLTIYFERGLPTHVEDLASSRVYSTPLEILKFLNDLGGTYGIGRIDIVENRYVGLKSRGVYETPGGTILYTAHQDLEVFSLDREVLRTKQLLRDRMADYVYNGFWFSPEALYVRRCIELAQERVSGQVTVELAPGYCRAVARKAAAASGGLYNEQLVSMDVHGGYVPQDAGGFIAINAVRIREHVRAFGPYEVKESTSKETK
ncbi:argininosuccinate synthase [Scaptodrosophila lebanonensis]|uniref:Argininosuccinate synthase n=1 Tax=Drosophila lebanonensis TaxID=7225 RepID=A0A6J2TCA5_DROLE|nr:argininosuccinate synthase [Scaptodrosophila lebanonensis]